MPPSLRPIGNGQLDNSLDTRPTGRADWLHVGLYASMLLGIFCLHQHQRGKSLSETRNLVIFRVLEKEVNDSDRSQSLSHHQLNSVILPCFSKEEVKNCFPASLTTVIISCMMHLLLPPQLNNIIPSVISHTTSSFLLAHPALKTITF